MTNMDKYLSYLEKQSTYSSIFESKSLEEEVMNENVMARKLKSLGWQRKSVDDETDKQYYVFDHPKFKKHHHEYYIDKNGDHFYHFYHNGSNTNIDAGLKHTFGDHLKTMKFTKMHEELDFGSEPLEENVAALAARAVGGLSALGSRLGSHASKAVSGLEKVAAADKNFSKKYITQPIKKALGTVGHVDLLTHNLGSTGTLSLQGGFIRQKDGNGRPSGDYKFNLRLRHDNWRTGQRTVRDLVGSEYKKKKDNDANSQQTFKPRFRYGRGLEQSTPPTADNEKPAAYDPGVSTGEKKAVKKFAAMKTTKKDT